MTGPGDTRVTLEPEDIAFIERVLSLWKGVSTAAERWLAVKKRRVEAKAEQEAQARAAEVGRTLRAQDNFERVLRDARSDG